MRKIAVLILSLIILCSCGSPRNDYYVFSFDDYTIAPGYDDVEFLKLVFDVDVKDTLEAKETLSDVDVNIWRYYVCSVDLMNTKNRSISVDRALVTKMDFFVGNMPVDTFKINDTILSGSVKNDCKTLKGELIERNGYACVLSQKAHGKTNVLILSGDIMNLDQDELHRIQIYVE